LIRTVGEGKVSGTDWESLEGYLARIVLLDQLTRNAFRGSADAFKYDEAATSLAIDAVDKGYAKKCSLPELQFLCMPLMHSENLEHHKILQSVTEVERKRIPKEVQGMFDRFAGDFAGSHRKVLEKFGRYPHRYLKNMSYFLITIQAFCV